MFNLFKRTTGNSGFVGWIDDTKNDLSLFNAYWAGYEASREGVRIELQDQDIEFNDCSIEKEYPTNMEG